MFPLDVITFLRCSSNNRVLAAFSEAACLPMRVRSDLGGDVWRYMVAQYDGDDSQRAN